jgi:hypothetical protein
VKRAFSSVPVAERAEDFDVGRAQVLGLVRRQKARPVHLAVEAHVRFLHCWLSR